MSLLLAVRCLLLVSMCAACSSLLAAQQMYFPPVGDTTWERVTLEELGWCSDGVDTLINYLDSNKTRAFIVLKNGRIAMEWYADGFIVDDIWYWASAGKTVTSTLVGIAQAEGKLSISEISSKYLGVGWTSMPKEYEDQITIRHQLTMTTGLDDKEGDPYCTDPGCLVYKAVPGTRWAYHNAPYTMLDKVIENATGKTLNQNYIQKLCGPIGMNGLFVKDGYNNLLVSTPRSMARFGLLALNKFTWNGTNICNNAFGDDAVKRSQELNQSYGYLWWLNGQPTYMLPALQIVFAGPIAPNAPPDTYNGLGKNDQIVSVVPSQGLVVVRLGDAATPDGPQVPTTFLNEMWGLLRDVICEPVGVESREQGEGNIKGASSEERAANLKGANYDVYDVLGNFVGSNVQLDSLVSGMYVVRRNASDGLKAFDCLIVR